MDRLKYGILGGVAVAASIAFGLIAVNSHTPAIPAAALPSSPIVTTAPPSVPGNAFERDEVKQGIKDALAGYFAADDIDVTFSGKTQTVSAFSPDLTATVSAALQNKTVPDGWEDTVADLTAVEATLPELANISRSVLYVKSERNGDIYLTVSDGSVTYNVIEPPDDGHTAGPGYMTLDIYNQITTGMTYGDVVNLVGIPGTLSVESTWTDGDRLATYTWPGNGGIASTVSISFIGEKVESKLQVGLK